jgi:hypothetical protein
MQRKRSANALQPEGGTTTTTILLHCDEDDAKGKTDFYYLSILGGNSFILAATTRPEITFVVHECAKDLPKRLDFLAPSM